MRATNRWTAAWLVSAAIAAVPAPADLKVRRSEFGLNAPRSELARAEAVEVLTSTSALPAHLAGQLNDPYGYSMTSSGSFLVLDRRAHTVFAIDPGRTAMRRVLEIGQEIGRIIEPGVISLAANDVFAIADAPGGFERVQTFTDEGSRIGGFYMPRRTGARLTVGSIVLNGVGSMHYTGRSVLINQPQQKSVISELDMDGNVLRHVGTLRRTGYESDAELHQSTLR